MIGAEAALLLLEEMKSMPDACGVSPDIFTYTTVISGVARAEVRLNSRQLDPRALGKKIGCCIHLYSNRSNRPPPYLLSNIALESPFVANNRLLGCLGNPQDARRSGRHTKRWWPKLGTPTGSEEVDSGRRLTSTALCSQLYLEAVQRGVQVNGKICNAVMVGFGADLTVSGSKSPNNC